MHWFPLIEQLQNYRREDWVSDLTAGVITAVLLIPQGMAYAMLAGLPPQTGLYASVAPPILYALLGTSRTLAVGPVSVAAIMVASVLSAPEFAGGGDYLTNAVVLAAECGLILLVLGTLRAGVLVNFISHPVLSGFTTGAAVLIMVSQLRHLTGIQLESGLTPATTVWQSLTSLSSVNLATVMLAALSLLALYGMGRPLTRYLVKREWAPASITAISKSAPLMVVALGTFTVLLFALNDRYGVAVVGAIPSGLPQPSLGFLSADTWFALLPSAALIALIGYVESVSVAKFLANRERNRIDPDRELVALGAANLGSALSGTMPVAGGFSRTMVNHAAGAKTQVAALITAVLVGLAVMFLTPLFTYMPQAALAAIIVIAVSSLIDVGTIKHAWHYDRADALALMVTLVGVLVFGIEHGLLLGIAISLAAFLWRAGHPHIAVVGRVPGTEHYRNINRHQVCTWDTILLMRVDESLYFANAGVVEDVVMDELRQRPDVEHVVLICSAVNFIDASAEDMLERLRDSLAGNGMTLHLAEVKGPVMDRLERIDFYARLRPGQVFLSTDQAVHALVASSPDVSQHGSSQV
ncbi:MAG: sulfate permease [Pseudomonadota bacterium]|nr:sulfate permease [Pseudomonadota bacterium]